MLDISELTPKAKVGDTVWCRKYGKGRISYRSSIGYAMPYIHVEFSFPKRDGNLRQFDIEGHECVDMQYEKEVTLFSLSQILPYSRMIRCERRVKNESL
jgi:hypothetical protein